MDKVIADWERSGAGAGMVNNIAEDELDEQAMQTQYEFLDSNDQKSFLRECPVHVLLVPPLFIEGNSHSYNRSSFVFAGATVPY